MDCHRCFKPNAQEVIIPDPIEPMQGMKSQLCKGCKFEIENIFNFLSYERKVLIATTKAGEADRDALNQAVGGSNRTAESGRDAAAATPLIGAGPRTLKKGPEKDGGIVGLGKVPIPPK